MTTSPSLTLRAFAIRALPLLIIVLFASHAAFAPRSAAAGTRVDLELVLAVDASGSIDAGEFALQLEGIAAAFRDHEIVASARSGPHGRIAVMMLIWSDSHLPTASTSWHVIDGAMAAERFAREVEQFPRSIVDNGTGIGNALKRAMEAMLDNAFVGSRLVIDVSGDGRENTAIGTGFLIAAAREELERLGIEVNGLAIASQEPDLADYYRRNLITGPAAFVIEINTFSDFATAMRRKLLREIRGRQRVS